jgi:transketolase N-terminal domain/subunit
MRYLILIVAALCIAQLIAYEDAKAARPRVVLSKGHAAERARVNLMAECEALTPKVSC